MYDDLTEGVLPAPEDEAAREVFDDVLDIISAQASTNGKAAQLRDVLHKPHVQVRGQPPRSATPNHHRQGDGLMMIGPSVTRCQAG